MSACEKCWRDAHYVHADSVAEAYMQLVRERDCTPEEQAGPDATECPVCGRRTGHQITGECMACGHDPNVLGDGDHRRAVREARK